MRYLITGGSGFIGSALIRKLQETKTNKIFNIDKRANSNITDKKNIKNFIINLCDNSKLKKAIYEIKPEIVFHLAAESHVDRSIDNPSLFIESNILGTFNLLDSLKSYCNTLKGKDKNDFRFIHISTDEVYGSLPNEGYFNEKSIYNPSSPYASTKAASDHLVSSWFKTYNFPSIITHCSNNYGPRQFPDKLIPISLSRALKGEKILIYGDGKHKRDWLYVEDHINALIKISKKGGIGESYCIGSGNEISNIDLIKLLCNLLDKLSPKKDSYQNLIQTTHDRPGHDYRYAMDTKKIFQDLNWFPEIDLENGLKRTIEWYLNNKEWTQKIFNELNYFRNRIGLNI